MENSERRCENCRRSFEPDPTKKTQRFCTRKRCRQASHRAACQSYRRANPDDYKSRRPKIRAWARKRAYWSGWRAGHADYREREKARMRAKRAGANRVAKRDLRKRVFIEELREIQSQPLETVAKRDLRDRRVDALLACLIRKETSRWTATRSQNEIHADGVASAAQ